MILHVRFRMQFQITEGWWLSAQPGTIDSFNISEVTFTKYIFVSRIYSRVFYRNDKKRKKTTAILKLRRKWKIAQPQNTINRQAELNRVRNCSRVEKNGKFFARVFHANFPSETCKINSTNGDERTSVFVKMIDS